MSISWSHDPAERPSAERIKQMVQCPQFCHLIDAISMDTSVNILSACCVSVEKEMDNDNDDVFGNCFIELYSHLIMSFNEVIIQNK